MKMVKILTDKINTPDYHTIDVYLKEGGYSTIEKAIEMGQEKVIAELKTSNLRGRGGAGFPTGMKWSFITNQAFPRYLTVNADEGEPGTFKDRLIMTKNPHLLIEGIILTCLTLEIETAYIYIRGEFVKEAQILEAAIAEAYEKGLLGDDVKNTGKKVALFVHRGAGAYVCGEETALINSLEGKKGQPRLKPPFPAVVGLFNKPTIVNNVETIANIPFIIKNGGQAFADVGVERNGGTRLVGVSGHIKKPGVYELPMGFPLDKVIYDIAGGILDDKKLKAVIPGGSSTPVLKPNEIKDLPMDYDSIAKAGSQLGSAGVIVISEGTCMVNLLATLEKFYAHESCGQCTPCREGVPWVRDLVVRIENGEGRPGDIDKILDICDNMEGTTICPLATAAAWPAQSFIKQFRNEFEAHINQHKCPFN